MDLLDLDMKARGLRLSPSSPVQPLAWPVHGLARPGHEGLASSMGHDQA